MGAYVRVSGVVFALVALGHLLRVVAWAWRLRAGHLDPA